MSLERGGGQDRYKAIAGPCTMKKEKVVAGICTERIAL